MARNFDTDPIVVEFTVRLFVYDDIYPPNLSARIDRVCNNRRVHQEALELFRVADNVGLDEITGKIVRDK